MNTEFDVLEFMNGSKLKVIAIFGGPVNVNGIIRDVLTIEVDPKNASLYRLEGLFSNPNNLAYLHLYESGYDKKIEIGEGYTMLLGIEEVTEKVNQFPGKIAKPQYRTFYTVSIAQLTYDELSLFEYDPDNLPVDPDTPLTVGNVNQLLLSELKTTPVKKLFEGE